MPPHTLTGALCVVAFVPLFVAVRGMSGIYAFIGGLAVGAFAACLCCVNQDLASTGWIWAGYLILGATAGIGGIAWAEKRTFALCFAVLGVVEALTYLFLPVPIGSALWHSRFAMVGASVVGLIGISQLVWILNLLFAHLITSKQVVAATTAALVATIGLTVPNAGRNSNERMEICMVQTTGMDLQDVNRVSRTSSASLLVFPELAATDWCPAGDTRAVSEFMISNNRALISSFDDDASPPHNTATLFPERSPATRYWKRKLFAGERHIRSAGESPASVRWNGLQLGLNICYDTCFPGIMLDTANQKDLNLIVVPTLDPTSPNSIVAAFHAAFTPFRSAELGIPLVRVDTEAYSMATDADGNILRLVLPGEAMETVPVKPSRKPTLYRMIGLASNLWVALLVAIATMLHAIKRQRKRSSFACLVPVP